MFDLVITNGVIVNASGTIYPPNSDIGISDGMIECIGRNLKGSKTIDAHGAYVTPRGIDGHVHLDQVALPDVVGDNFEDGTQSEVVEGRRQLCALPLKSVTMKVCSVLSKSITRRQKDLVIVITGFI